MNLSKCSLAALILIIALEAILTKKAYRIRSSSKMTP